MNINPLRDRVAFVSLSFIILPIFILALSSSPSTSEIYIHGQVSDPSNNDEFLLSINQTYLSLIPLMIEEVQNTNATDIPIKNVINTVPSNATALQDIVQDNSNKTTQNGDSATLNNATANNSNNPSSPQDLIPVVVNMTQNTNASELGFMRIINALPAYDKSESNNTSFPK
ncbi:hypothetical protein BH23THE1_BH23THE1_15950 [soil metagenome]